MLSVQVSYRALCDVGGFDWNGLRGAVMVCALYYRELEAPRVAGISKLTTLSEGSLQQLLSNRLTADLSHSEVLIYLVGNYSRKHGRSSC